MPTLMTKTCGNCHETLPTDAFYKQAASKDGMGHRCKSCSKTKYRQWADAHVEQILERHRVNYHKAIEARRAKAHQRYDNNREVRKEIDREYYRKTAGMRRIQAREKYERNRNNPEWVAKEWARINNMGHLKRARMGSASPETMEYMAVLRGDPCSYCGNVGGTIDHIVPIIRGGQHERDNLTGACQFCNSSKKDKGLLQFLVYKGGI